MRVLLIGPDERILLVRFSDPRLNRGRVFWATVGGEREPGESIQDGARREAFEETGLTDLELGPVVWLDDPVIKIGEETVQFRETYVVAHTKGGALSRAGFTEEEKAAVTDLKWWTVEEIRAATEQVFPEVLGNWLPEILARQYPDPPRRILR